MKLLLSTPSIFLFTCILVHAQVNGQMFLSGFNHQSNPPNQYSDYMSSVFTPSVSCTSSSNCIRLKHNGTIVDVGAGILVRDLSLFLNDTGVYTCELYPPSNDICDHLSSPASTTLNKSLLIIDSDRINVPEYQFVFLNDDHTLTCDSDAYDLNVNQWTRENNEVHVGVVNNTQFTDEGNYTCHFTILQNENKRTTQLIVLVKPQISTLENHLQTLIGPSLNNITITYTAKSPGNEKITWYHNGTKLSDRLIHQSHDLGGASTLQVYRRHHQGTYKVVIQSLFNEIAVPEQIFEQSTSSYTFEVEVTVPPSPPILDDFLISSKVASISITPTNVTIDDSPDMINLTLTHDSHTVKTVSLTNNVTQYNFTELTPSTDYTIMMSVKNIDKIVNGKSLTFTTAPSDPSPSVVSIIRTDILHFNLSLSFHYLGAPSLSIIKLGYRTVNEHEYQYIDITNSFTDLALLNNTAHFMIDNDTNHVIADSRLQVIVEVANSEGYIATTDPVFETIEQLSAVLRPALSSLTKTSVSMRIQLPLSGTPPILDISVKFSSHAHIYYHNISGYYVTKELVNVYVGGEGTFPLMGNTTYVVTARAKNLGTWSSDSDGKSFTTYYRPIVKNTTTGGGNNGDGDFDDSVDGIVPSTTSSSTSTTLPIWAIILSGVIPSIALVLIVVSTILFVLLIKKYLKRPKGYPINELTAADRNRMDHSPGESRRIAKFFSYEQPLMPRPATAEPSIDGYPPPPAYPPSSSHDDSDSESNLTGPKYRYTVSPTHNEIGLQGFLGSTPGSGTYVYV